MKTCQQFYLALLDVLEKRTVSTNNQNISTLAKTLRQSKPQKAEESYSTVKLPKVCFFDKDGELDTDLISIISILSSFDDEAASNFKKRLDVFWRQKESDITLKALFCMTGQAMPELPIELSAMLDEIYKTLGPDDALAHFKGSDSSGINEMADDALEQYFRSLLMDHVVAAMPEGESAITLYYSNVLYRKPANIFYPVKTGQQDIASIMGSVSNIEPTAMNNIHKLQEGYLLGTLNQLLPESMEFIALMSLYLEEIRNNAPMYINVDAVFLELSNYMIDLIDAALMISDKNKRDQVIEQMLLAQYPDAGPAQAIRLAAQYDHDTCISILVDAALKISDNHKRDQVIEQMLLAECPGTGPANAIRLAAHNGHDACISELINGALKISDTHKRDQVIEQMLLAAFPGENPANAIGLASKNGHPACISELINAALKISDNHKHDQVIEQMLLAEDPSTGPANAIREASFNGHDACISELINSALKISDNHKRDQVIEKMLLAKDPVVGPAQAIRLASENGHAACISELINSALKISDNHKRDQVIEQMLLAEDPRTGPANAIRLASKNGHADCISKLINAALKISDNHKRDQVIEQMLLAEYPNEGPANAIRLASKNGHSACISELINAALKISDNHKRDQVIEQLLLAKDPVHGHAQAIRLASEYAHSPCLSELLSAIFKLSSVDRQVTAIQSILDLKESDRLLDALIITPEIMTFFLSSQNSDGSYLLADTSLKAPKLYEKIILKACNEGKLSICDLAYLLMPKQTPDTPMVDIDHLQKYITLRSKEMPAIMSDSDMQVICIFLSLVKLRHDTGEKNNNALNTLLNFCLDNEVRAFEVQNKGCCSNSANLMPSFEQSFFLKKYKPHLRWRENCAPSKESLVEALHQSTMWGNGSRFSKVDFGLKALQKAFPKNSGMQP